MSVPNNHFLCRFIRPSNSYWSTTLQRPKPKAFAPDPFSVWDKDKLGSMNSTLAELQIESLARTGQAQHKTEDYYRFADEVEQEERVEFAMRVDYQTDDGNVEEAWRQWREAHAEVKVTKQPPVFPYQFRHKLAKNCRIAIAPDGMLPLAGR
jgi:hypothetical protein